MSTNVGFPSLPEGKKSFWKRPEGVTGTVVLAGLLIGGGVALYKVLPYLITLTSNLLYLSGMLLVLGAIIYVVLDPKFRTMIGYMYKSMMRWITGIFVNIDPIGILKSYIDTLSESLGKMSDQIGVLRGQYNKVQTILSDNKKEIETQLRTAQVAQKQGKEAQMVLATRKAARLQESNTKYESLLSKMDILSRVLKKMYEASEVLLEDTKDQVKVKEVERKAIRASHSAMKSAMSIITGNNDQRALFDQALESVADDVALKVGEMERFMELSEGFMNSVDLQNGVFEEEGLKMLEKFETSAFLLTSAPKSQEQVLNLNEGRPKAVPVILEATDGQENKYDELFQK